MKAFIKISVFIFMTLYSGFLFADPSDSPKLMIDLMINVGDESFYVMKIVLAVCGFIGLALSVHGLHKIRSHPSDSSGQGGAWRQGVVQLIVGSLLFTIPVVGLLMSSSLFDGSGGQGIVPTDSSVFQQISNNNYGG